MKNKQVQMDLRGPDLEGLATCANTVLERMKKAGGYADLDLSYETGKPEIHLHIRRDAAADLGVDVNAIASAVKTLIGGDEITKFKVSGDRYDVSVRLDDGQRNKSSDILDLTVRNHRGELVSLRNLVDVVPVAGPVQIDRYNRQRQVTIEANLVQTKTSPNARTLVLGEAKEELKRFVAEARLPAGCNFYVIGMAEIMEESFGYLVFALAMAVILVIWCLPASSKASSIPLPSCCHCPCHWSAPWAF